jgi:co-chaperonin GroES (HSP10)
MTTPNQKVDFDEALKELMNELERIDSSDLSQSQRTAQYKRLAAKVINTHLKDGDNFRADNKLGITTLNKYLTRLRTAVRAANYRHHSLINEKARGWTTTNKETGAVRNYVTLSKLIGDYPEYAETLETLRNEHALTLRKRVKEIAGAVIAGKQPTKRERELYRIITSGLKVEHEILFHLALDSAQKSLVKQHQGGALERKQHDTVVISHAAIMGIISEYLATESIYKQLYALALSCGRRFIEVAKQGNFEIAGEHRVMFSGQAKKRAGHVETPYPIYTLIPAHDFITAIERLRGSQQMADLHKKVEEKKAEKGMVTPDFDNAFFNTITATSSNYAAKTAMQNRGMAKKVGDEVIYHDTNTTVTFKDSRAIYAAICLQDWHEKDAPQLDDNAFVSQLMGHEGGTAHLNYRQFRIKRDLPAFLLAVNTDVADTQLEAADGQNTADLDAAFSALPDVRESLKRCHEKVVAWANANPTKKLTQTSIEKDAKGGNRAVVKDYIAALNKPLESYNRRLLK